PHYSAFRRFDGRAASRYRQDERLQSHDLFSGEVGFKPWLYQGASSSSSSCAACLYSAHRLPSPMTLRSPIKSTITNVVRRSVTNISRRGKRRHGPALITASSPKAQGRRRGSITRDGSTRRQPSRKRKRLFG